MKCKNCGANYRTKELKCPYCGTENVIGRIWLIERDTVRQEYEEAYEETVKRSRLYVFDKILNRIILVSLGLVPVCVLLAALALGGYRVYREIYKKVHAEEISRTVEEYYEAGQYWELYQYMNDCDVLGSQYDPYGQAAFMGFDYEFYKNTALYFLSLSEEEKQEDEYFLDAAICFSHDVYSLNGGLYDELSPQNRELYRQNQEDVMAFWRGTLGMTEEEAAFLAERKQVESSDIRELVEAVRARRAWE